MNVLQENMHRVLGMLVKYDSNNFTPKHLREFAGSLANLADELEGKRKFKTGDDIYFVDPKGEVMWLPFNSESATHLGLVASENAFKTCAEASDNILVVMEMYKKLKGKGLI